MDFWTQDADGKAVYVVGADWPEAGGGNDAGDSHVSHNVPESFGGMHGDGDKTDACSAPSTSSARHGGQGLLYGPPFSPGYVPFSFQRHHVDRTPTHKYKPSKSPNVCNSKCTVEHTFNNNHIQY